MPQHLPTLALIALLLALGLPDAGAKPICRWVDANGRQQLSEVVPEAFRQQATCTDSRQYELTPAQRRAATQRADDARARAVRDAARLAADPPAIAAAASAVPPAPAKRPAETVTDSTDCATWWRLYDESVQCFGPYRMVNGALKAEAFERCNVIGSPDLQCGLRSR